MSEIFNHTYISHMLSDSYDGKIFDGEFGVYVLCGRKSRKIPSATREMYDNLKSVVTTYVIGENHIQDYLKENPGLSEKNNFRVMVHSKDNIGEITNTVFKIAKESGIRYNFVIEDDNARPYTSFCLENSTNLRHRKYSNTDKFLRVGITLMQKAQEVDPKIALSGPTDRSTSISVNNNIRYIPFLWGGGLIDFEKYNLVPGPEDGVSPLSEPKHDVVYGAYAWGSDLRVIKLPLCMTHNVLKDSVFGFSRERVIEEGQQQFNKRILEVSNGQVVSTNKKGKGNADRVVVNVSLFKGLDLKSIKLSDLYPNVKIEELTCSFDNEKYIENNRSTDGKY